jgi:hypothetical protein
MLFYFRLTHDDLVIEENCFFFVCLTPKFGIYCNCLLSTKSYIGFASCYTKSQKSVRILL